VTDFSGFSGLSDPASLSPEAADREVMGLTLSAGAQLLAGLLQGTQGPGGEVVLSALSASRSLALTVDDMQRTLVRQARAQGHSWAAVGQVLHVTRQAAFQRFGGDVQEDAAAPGGEPVTASLPGAPEAAARALFLFVTGRFDEMRAGFDARMVQACPVELLGQAHAKVEREVGGFRELGTASTVPRSGFVVVDVPMAFERGDRVGRVTFNGEAEVSGFFVLPGEGADREQTDHRDHRDHRVDPTGVTETKEEGRS
jgi:hypothetical protein